MGSWQVRPRSLFNLFKCLDAKRRPPLWFIASEAKELSVSMAGLWSRLSPNLCNSHPDSCQGRWTCFANLCHQASLVKGSCSLLSEICGLTEQEGHQGSPCSTRQDPAGSRSPSLRGQEVRWSWRQSKIPKILSLRFCGCSLFL